MTYLNSSVNNLIDNNNPMSSYMTAAELEFDATLFASLNYTEDGYEAYLTALSDIDAQ